MANHLRHQQRCLSPSWSYLARRDGFFPWILSKSSPVPAFFILFLHIFPVYNLLSPLIYLRCPIGLTSYINKGRSVDPQKICVAYALHMHCIMYLWHVATPYTRRRVDLRNRIHLPIWVLAPEASGHIFVFPAFLSPFNCAYGYAFNSKFLFIP